MRCGIKPKVIPDRIVNNADHMELVGESLSICSLGIELFFIRGKLAKQSEKLACMSTFLIGYVPEYLYSKLIVG
jgi:hypothetical protein